MQVEASATGRGLVTVARFVRFTEDTGYVTPAEGRLDPADYPDADPFLLAPGSALFHPAPAGTNSSGAPAGIGGSRWALARNSPRIRLK